MRWFVPLAFLVILMLGCSGAAPTALPAPTVDVSATVEAAVEATRAVDRSVSATLEARAESTRAAVPTATPVVMTIYAPTPEPYVAAPGSIEQGIEELHTCLQESDEFRAVFFSMIEESGVSRDSAEALGGVLLEDKDLFVEAALLEAEEDPEYASMLSLLGGMAGDLCSPVAQVSPHDLGMSDADAEALLGEVYDCYHSDPDFQTLMTSSEDNRGIRVIELVTSDRDLFVGIMLLGAQEDPESAEALGGLDSLVDSMCR